MSTIQNLPVLDSTSLLLVLTWKSEAIFNSDEVESEAI